jgi:hypothetical protein
MSLKTPSAVIASIGLLLTASMVLAGPGFNNKYSPDEVTVQCLDENGNVVGTVVYGGPLKMWPPNHKYQPVSIVATAVDPDDQVEFSTQGTHDEYLDDGSEMNGAGNTDMDVNPPAAADGPSTGSARTEHELRSERSGQGDGRTYTLDWQARFTDIDGDGADNNEPYAEVVCGSADLGMNGFEPNADAFLVVVPHDMRCGADWKGGHKGNGGNGQCSKSK